MLGAAEQLVKKIENREATVGVCGLGYVGLPLIGAFYHAGFKTYGFDIDDAKIDALTEGRSYIEHIDFDRLKAAIGEDKFVPTSDFGRIGEPDVILIAVPTPLTHTREPDLAAVRGTCQQIAKGLRKDQLIVLESTTYPGTTQEVCIPILEESGLKAGEDFFVAYSPEREDPGNPNFETSTIPKVVGSLNEASGLVASAVYSAIIQKVVPVTSMGAAELCKIFENTFRAVNIALVNELKLLCLRMDIDVWEVIDAAKTKPFGFMPFYPGPGLGGHCIPIDPFYLTWKAREYDFSTRFIELAGEINTSMPYEVVDGLMRLLNDEAKPLKGSKVFVLGVAYKKNVDDIRESPSLKIIDELLKKGAVISYHDPHIPVMKRSRHYPDMPELKSLPINEKTLAEHDAVFILTDHDAVDYDLVCNHAQLVVDTRNACKNASNTTKVKKL